MRRKFNITTDQPETASEALSQASGLSRQRIKDAMNKGACWWTLKGKQVRLRRATKELKVGTRLQLYYDESVLDRKPEAATLIADKSRYSVWFKPHGLLAQGSQWGDHCSLLRCVELELKRPCFLIHRLDADAAGLMLIAHDSKAAGALSQCFSGRTMTKHYLARVTGIIHTRDQLIDTPVDGKAAISRATTLSTDETSQTSLLQVAIETGRKHQIRKHLESIGHPIVGDRLYGKPTKATLQLLAVSLEFDCPLSRQRVKLELPEPLNRLEPA
ncbi:MAG: RluA family pseudouridine synthase [Marinobacter sp.]|uniref:RluA family pseudouridine synthase n=3 Tax=Pseudomonadales TaxID=72274 RepID=UPI001B76478E|nr:RluA family pseudouridine synthase [Marinobacter sp.]MBQ0745622.1 RluA family pseudouridine synthase [Marinobacter sp.]MBQ0814561.1 RluA family pseudouridine synthase [Marinobacter sp.]|tara:strand:+ start:5523 stop:6341 length:819 start_codon:yes stop_codon:yes gene_type:complete